MVFKKKKGNTKITLALIWALSLISSCTYSTVSFFPQSLWYNICSYYTDWSTAAQCVQQVQNSSPIFSNAWKSSSRTHKLSLRNPFNRTDIGLGCWEVKCLFCLTVWTALTSSTRAVFKTHAAVCKRISFVRRTAWR